MTQKSVVCFDIGIKNLAFCHLSLIDEGKYELIGWDNINLLSETGKTVAESPKLCFGCKSKALYEGGSCTRHCTKPPLVDLSGNKLMKFPSGKILREILLVKEPATKKSAQKKDILESLRKHYSLPVEKVKVVKTSQVDMSYLHDAMRKLVIKEADGWRGATEICLENQPAFKNPQMKSVQMLLFATIRDILQPNPPKLRLVHAGTKVKGKAKGDEGYADRKKGSEDRVTGTLSKVTDTKGLIGQYQMAGKKNDLADAFCMCLDALSC